MMAVRQVSLAIAFLLGVLAVASAVENNFDEGIACDGEDLDPAESGNNKINIINPKKHWKDGIVPYVIEDRYNDERMKKLMDAMEDYHKYTCIRFVPRTDEKAYISIWNGTRCSTGIGSNGGRLRVSLKANRCFGGNGGTIRHELMHTLGFHHEMVRPDRDEYVTVKWENILDDRKHNFNKVSESQYDTQGLPYDYSSIMHYGSRQASKNGKAVMVSRQLGQFLGLKYGKKFSNLDLQKINSLYNCDQKGY